MKRRLYKPIFLALAVLLLATALLPFAQAQALEPSHLDIPESQDQYWVGFWLALAFDDYTDFHLWYKLITPEEFDRLTKDDGSNYTTQQSTGTLSDTDVTYTLGSPTDTWSHEWTDDELANGAFRMKVEADCGSQCSSNRKAEIDLAQVKYKKVSGTIYEYFVIRF